MTDAEPTNTAETPARRQRDWRYWVGGTGRTLMVIGVLMFGFVGYQLWGTGIEYRQHQNELADEFADLQAEFEAVSPSSSMAEPTTTGTPSSASTPTAPTTVDTTTPVTTAPTATTPITTTPDTTAPVSTTPDTTTPDTTAPDTTAPDTTVPGDTSTWPAIRRGQAVALMEIPRIKKKVFAVNGVRASDLKRGLGHFPNTPLPGQFGNSAFAGHRTTYGAPLFDIDRLGPGDEIIVTTITNRRYVYVVDGPPKVVKPNALNVIVTTDTEVARLTLTSCHPRWSAEQRIVVSAVLDAAQSAPAEFPKGPPSGSTDPGSEPEPEDNVDWVNDPTGTGVTSNSTIGETPSDNSDPSAVDGTPGDDTPGDDVDPNASPSETESFTRGWFDDTGAWWHVAGWGALELGVVLGGWFLARRSRRWWVGTLAATVPFLAVLYFVYQNINRLLPPAL